MKWYNVGNLKLYEKCTTFKVKYKKCITGNQSPTRNLYYKLYYNFINFTQTNTFAAVNFDKMIKREFCGARALATPKWHLNLNQFCFPNFSILRKNV